jgi:hypothetical protein
VRDTRDTEPFSGSTTVITGMPQLPHRPRARPCPATVPKSASSTH